MGESDKSVKYNCGELSLQPSHHAHVVLTWKVILALVLLTLEKGPQDTLTITHKRSEWRTSQVRGNKYKETSFPHRWSRKGLESAQAAGSQPSLAPSSPGDLREWNIVIRDFLSAAGLTQAVRGFDADIMVMNPGFEREVVPGALDYLLDSLVVSYACRLAAPVTYPLIILHWQRLGKQSQRPPQQRPLDQRKLEHVHLRPGTEPKTQRCAEGIVQIHQVSTHPHTPARRSRIYHFSLRGIVLATTLLIGPNSSPGGSKILKATRRNTHLLAHGRMPSRLTETYK